VSGAGETCTRRVAVARPSTRGPARAAAEGATGRLRERPLGTRLQPYVMPIWQACDARISMVLRVEMPCRASKESP